MRRDERQPTVLLIEDDPLVALDLGDTLREAGYRVAGPLASQAEALAWMARHRPDLAVVDLPLRDGDGSRLARALREQGVPFLVQADVHVDVHADVHADGARDAATCAALRAAPRLTRPAWRGDLLDVLGRLSRGPIPSGRPSREVHS